METSQANTLGISGEERSQTRDNECGSWQNGKLDININ